MSTFDAHSCKSPRVPISYIYIYIDNIIYIYIYMMYVYIYIYIHAYYEYGTKTIIRMGFGGRISIVPLFFGPSG